MSYLITYYIFLIFKEDNIPQKNNKSSKTMTVTSAIQPIL